jgi:hypothetical protein
MSNTDATASGMRRRRSSRSIALAPYSSGSSLAHVSRDRLGGAPATAGQRSLVIGQLGLLPARLRVAQQV